jgi:phosphate acetyltransferase
LANTVALFDNIFAVARAVNNRIVFSEGHDPRVVKAAIMAIRDGLAMPILIGQRSRILREIKIHGAFSSCITIVDPGDTGTNNFYAEAYSKLPQYEGIALATAKRAVADPLILAALMVRLGKAEGTISGAVATTADTIRAAIQIIGPGPEVACVSSFFLMLLDQPHHPKQGIMCFADCGLIIEPSVSELAQIAVSTAESFQVLTGETPRIAMLSFSTNG